MSLRRGRVEAGGGRPGGSLQQQEVCLSTPIYFFSYCAVTRDIQLILVNICTPNSRQA